MPKDIPNWIWPTSVAVLAVLVLVTGTLAISNARTAERVREQNAELREEVVELREEVAALEAELEQEEDLLDQLLGRTLAEQLRDLLDERGIDVDDLPTLPDLPGIPDLGDLGDLLGGFLGGDD